MSNYDPNDPAFEGWQELLAGYVLGDLSSAEMTQVQQYLAKTPAAQAEVAELQAALNLLPLSLPEDVAPPIALQAQLLQAAVGIPQEGQRVEAVPGEEIDGVSMQVDGRQPRAVPWGGLGRSPRRIYLALAAATAAALLGWQNLQLRNQLQLAQQALQFAQQRSAQLEQIETQLASAKASVAEYQEIITMLRLPENRLLALSGASGFTETSSGSVVIAPERNWAMLTLQGLPKPPDGKAYQLWAMADGKKVYCIEFKPDQTGQVLVKIPVDNWAGTPMVSITLEEEGTIPSEASEMVMNGAVI